MARANLTIQNDILSTFSSSQDCDSDVRIILVKIQGESLTLHSTISKVGNTKEDFDSLLVTNLSDTEASFVLFCLSDDINKSENKNWLLVAWIPDSCKVRDKMLYSSSREDLKRSLGSAFFTAEYAANYKTDISWDCYINSLKKGFDFDLLTETEKLILEEKALTLSESTTSKSTAMNVLPFNFDPILLEKFKEVKESNPPTTNWLELKVLSETVHLVKSSLITDFSSIQEHINQQEARFIIMKIPKGSTHVFVFVFSCPEEVHVRIKMTMSSSKATVIATAEQNGIKIDKTLEIRNADEIDELIRSEIFNITNSDSLNNNNNASSANANILHSKPQKPGKPSSKVKVAKFNIKTRIIKINNL